MLTIASIPKPFVGATKTIQENALASWRALSPGIKIVLLGDEPGLEAAAVRAGAERALADVGRIPRVDEVFAQLSERAETSLRAFVNTDVVFLDDLTAAIDAAGRFAPRWLLVGQTCDVSLGEAAVGGAGWQQRVRAQGRASGRLRGAGAIDYLIFTDGVFDDVPPFLVGRAGFDNWLIWRARSHGVPVIDATNDVLAVHQSHDYAHLGGGKLEAYLGAEAVSNVDLAGGKRHMYSICDASHRLRAGKIDRNPWATFRLGDIARRARWKLGLRGVA